MKLQSRDSASWFLNNAILALIVLIFLRLVGVGFNFENYLWVLGGAVAPDAFRWLRDRWLWMKWFSWQ